MTPTRTTRVSFVANSCANGRKPSLELFLLTSMAELVLTDTSESFIYLGREQRHQNEFGGRGTLAARRHVFSISAVEDRAKGDQ